jgi:hypothetical protein
LTWRYRDLRPLLVEVDKPLGDRLTLGGIGAQRFRPGAAFKNAGELTAEIERFLHRDIHALPRLRGIENMHMIRKGQMDCGESQASSAAAKFYSLAF